jgi:hypothetical protein
MRRFHTDSHSLALYAEELERDLEEWDNRMTKGINNSVIMTLDKAVRA